MSRPLFVGNRVVISLANPKEWATEFVSLIEGATGRVDEAKTHHDNGQDSLPLVSPRYFVVFDKPVKRHWNNIPLRGLWFEAGDLEVY